MTNKKIILPIFTFLMFSILMVVQIDTDTTTTDFKVGAIINTLCAENINAEWASCNAAMGIGTRRDVSCTTCSVSNSMPNERDPNLCRRGEQEVDIEG